MITVCPLEKLKGLNLYTSTYFLINIYVKMSFSNVIFQNDLC